MPLAHQVFVLQKTDVPIFFLYYPLTAQQNLHRWVSNCVHWLIWMVICIIVKFIKERTKRLLINQCPSILAKYQLAKPLHDKHHQVFIDDYFRTAPLMEYLLEDQMYCCGMYVMIREILSKELERQKDILESGIWLLCF